MKITDLDVCSFLQYAVISFHIGSNIFLGEAFSKILSQQTYLNIKDKISHLQKPMEKMKFFYILIF